MVESKRERYIRLLKSKSDLYVVELTFDAVKEIIELLEESERVKGRWIINSDGYYPYCSECRKEPKSGDKTDFCPNCGADMRGELGDYEKKDIPLDTDDIFDAELAKRILNNK